MDYICALMPGFKQEIEANHGMYIEFYFRPIQTATGSTYFISASDPDQKNFTFTMVQKVTGAAVLERWRIVNAPMVPDWILAIENELSEAIRLHNEKDNLE